MLSKCSFLTKVPCIIKNNISFFVIFTHFVLWFGLSDIEKHLHIQYYMYILYRTQSQLILPLVLVVKLYLLYWFVKTKTSKDEVQWRLKIYIFCWINYLGLGGCGLRWSDDGLPQGIAMYGAVILFILTMLCANIAIIVRVQKSKRFQTKSSTGGAVSARNIKTAQIVGELIS